MKNLCPGVPAALLGAAALIAALAAPEGAFAQSAEPAASPAVASEPAAIALPSLVVEAESAERFARSVGEQLAPSRELRQIEEALTLLAPELEQRTERLDALLAEPATPLDALAAEARDWGTRHELLARWQRDVTDRAVALEREIAELEARSEIWRRTRDATREMRAPAEALARIESVQTALRAAHRDARAARSGLVELQSRIAEHEASVARGIERLDEARNAAEISLLESDSPQLWDALGDSPDVWAPLAAQLASDAALAREYLARPAGRAFAHALAFAFLSWLCFSGRAFAARVREDVQLRASAVVFERPLASAGLVVLSLTPLFHPQAPASLLAISRIALIVPLLRLLPALAPPEAFGAIRVAGLLALVGEIRGTLSASPVIERSLFAFELGIAAATLAWLMRPARLALLRGGRQLPLFLHGALRASLFALLVAFAANAFGWSNLAHLLGAGTLRALYAALVVYGGARVLRAGLRALTLSERAERLRLFRDHGDAVQANGARLVNLGGIALWAALTLMGFGLWEAFTRAARAAWSFELAYGSLAVSLGDVLTFALTIWAAIGLARLTRFVLEGDVLAHFDTQRGVAHAVARTAQYLVLLLGFFAAAAAAGIDMNRFAILAGAFGVGIGFGLQNIVNNFVSGLILLYERPIQVGDTIEVGGVFGDVERIGMRSSTVRTWEGAEVIVPNATLISERVTNWTLSDRTRRIDVRVGVAYGSRSASRTRSVVALCPRASRGARAPRADRLVHGLRRQRARVRAALLDAPRPLPAGEERDLARRTRRARGRGHRDPVSAARSAPAQRVAGGGAGDARG